MSMATNFFFFATWFLFFFIIPLKPGIYIVFQGLRVCWHYSFSRATENETMAAIFIFLLQNSLLTR